MDGVAYFLCSLPIDGPLRQILEGIPKSTGIYTIERTLHINLHKVEGYLEDLNYILFITHLGLVDEVRIHTLCFKFYMTPRRKHCRIYPSTWVLAKLFLRHIAKVPLAREGSLSSRKLKITFDDFLKPAIDAWRVLRPFQHLVEDIPKITLISKWSYIWWINLDPEVSDDDYISTSEEEDSSGGDDDGFYGVMDENGVPRLVGHY